MKSGQVYSAIYLSAPVTEHVDNFHLFRKSNLLKLSEMSGIFYASCLTLVSAGPKGSPGVSALLAVQTAETLQTSYHCCHRNGAITPTSALR